ncbi:hypothetical protein HAX54_050809 [Datura stramonium]|uniref:Uncharacterized protein n=1 Tax=Datura stramonium TaxID=4076 RepID=A0ABS8WNY6_DATST|nr:hypothetical protein [Datura stramonium]
MSFSHEKFSSASRGKPLSLSEPTIRCAPTKSKKKNTNSDIAELIVDTILPLHPLFEGDMLIALGPAVPEALDVVDKTTFPRSGDMYMYTYPFML